MEIYLVGGAVRDQLLNLPCEERDWVVVGANANELLEQGFQQVGHHFPVFLHPTTHEEYALARKEKKTGQGHQGFSCQFSPDVSLEEDLLRRDLTINAIAQDENGEYIDPYHGINDLQHKILRHVSPAFIEDPLRVLRTARFAARLYHLGFHIAPETLQLMQDIVASRELLSLSRERLWKEWQKAFSTSHPEIYLQTLHACGALEQLMPEINASVLFESKWQAFNATSPQIKMMLFWEQLIIGTDIHAKINLFKQFSEHLCVPKTIQETSIRFFKLAEKLRQPSLSVQDIFNLCEQVDAYRQSSSMLIALDAAMAMNLVDQAQVLKWQTLIQQGHRIPLPEELKACQNIPQIQAYVKAQRLILIEKIMKH